MIGASFFLGGLRAWGFLGGCQTIAVHVQARALFDAPEGAPHLLGFYSRVAASLAQVFPDMAAALLRSLEEEFALLQVPVPTKPGNDKLQYIPRREHIQVLMAWRKFSPKMALGVHAYRAINARRIVCHTS